MIPVLLYVACLASTALVPEIELKLAEAQHIQHPTHHVQGLEVDAANYWITSVDRREKKGWIYRVDRRSLKVDATIELTEGSRYHPGGIQISGGSLWVPLAEYRPRSSTTILQLDPTSLKTLGSGEVADHLGAIVVLGKEELLGCDWDSRQFLWMTPNGSVRERFENPTRVAYQDAKFRDGRVWAAGNTKIAGRSRSVVDVIAWPQRRLVRRYILSGQRRTGGDAFSAEGFCLFGNSLYLLPEDGPDSTVYRFNLP